MADLAERTRSNLLLCALVTPLETGREFPEEDELDAEEEDALDLIMAACLRGGEEIRSHGSALAPHKMWLHPPGFGQRFAVRLTVVV